MIIDSYVTGLIGNAVFCKANTSATKVGKFSVENYLTEGLRFGL